MILRMAVVALSWSLAGAAWAEGGNSVGAQPESVPRNETLVSLLLGGGEWTVSAGAVAKITRLAQTGDELLGARIGFMRSQGSEIGLGAFATPRDVDFPFRGAEAKLRLRYWGVHFGHEENNRDLIQSYAHLFLGMASAEVRQRDGTLERDSAMFVTEPEVGLALKITSWMRFGVGLSWRGIWGSNLAHTSSRTLDAWATTLSLNVGNYVTTCRGCELPE